MFGFVFVDEFKDKIWEAKLVGVHQGWTIRKAHEKLLQSVFKEPPKIGQAVLKPIFFPRYKSPQKSAPYKKTQTLKIESTPYGSRGADDLIVVNPNERKSS